MILDNFHKAATDFDHRKEDPIDSSILKFNSDAPQTVCDSSEYFDDSDFFIRTSSKRKKKTPKLVLNFSP